MWRSVNYLVKSPSAADASNAASCTCLIVSILAVQHIRFDDFNVWEGRCTPDAEPLPTTEAIVLPVWSGQRSDFTAPTHLTAAMAYTSTSLGSACGTLQVRNWASAACSSYTLEVNVKPGWGAVANVDAVALAPAARSQADVAAGALATPARSAAWLGLRTT